MKVLIAGGSGFLGQALTRELTEHGHQVHLLVRRPARAATEVEWHPEYGGLDPDALRGYAAVVGLSGAGIGDRRWTPAYKQELVDSRIRPTETLAKTLAFLPQAQRPRTFLSASAVGYYGDRGDDLLPETGGAGSGFLAELVVRWEAATQPAADAGVRVVTLRTGLVLSARGGLLARLIPLYRKGSWRPARLRAAVPALDIPGGRGRRHPLPDRVRRDARRGQSRGTGSGPKLAVQR